MEEKVIKAATVMITAISIIVAGTLLFFPQLHIRAEENRELRAQEAIERKENMDALEMLQYNTANVDSQEGISFDQQLRIALPENVTPEDVSVENDYLTQTIIIKIPGADENYLYNYPMIGKSYHIDNLTYENEPEYGVIEISLDSVVELQKTSDEHYIYMDFLTPHEVYDKVVVIDAGHSSALGRIIMYADKEVCPGFVCHIYTLFKTWIAVIRSRIVDSDALISCFIK